MFLSGRAEGAFTFMDSQMATRILHGHSEVFIQSSHQRIGFINVFEFLKKGNAEVVCKYLQCKAHACSQVCADNGFADQKLLEHDVAWPQYKEFEIVSPRPL